MPLFQKVLEAEKKNKKAGEKRKLNQVRQVSKSMPHDLVPRFGPEHPSGQCKEGNIIRHVISTAQRIFKKQFRCCLAIPCPETRKRFLSRTCTGGH